MNNYCDEEDVKKRIYTSLSMLPGEFEQFSVSQETSVTFCLKELKSIIAFAESINLPVTASFSEGGQPIVFTLKQVGQTLEL